MIGHLDTFDKVSDGIYIGNSSASKNLNLLKASGITHILICSKESEPIFSKEFEYKKLEITDAVEFNVAQYFEESFEFIELAINQHGGVFVHCIMGQSRSATICLAYLMRKRQLSVKKALALLIKKHRDTQPNVGFINQLNKYERDLKENSSEAKINNACANCIIF